MPESGRHDDVAGSEAVPAADELHARVEILIERGLEKYGQGDLSGALGEWEHALTLEPDAARALEYIDYVRTNFDLLERQFTLAREVAARAEAEGVPVPEVPEEVSDAYEMIELSRGSGPKPTLRGVLPPQEEPAPIEEGWAIDDLAAPLPPPPAPKSSRSTLDRDLDEISAGFKTLKPGEIVNVDESMTLEVGVDDMLTPQPGMLPDAPAAAEPVEASEEDITVPGGEPPPPLPERPAFAPEALEILGNRPPVVTIHPRGEGTSPGELPAPPQAATPPELDLELGGLDPSVPDDRALDEGSVPPPPSVHMVDLEPDEDAGTVERAPGGQLAVEDLPTLERGVAPAGPEGAEDDFPELELGGDFDDGPKTRERPFRASGRAPVPSVPGDPNVIVDQVLLSDHASPPAAAAALGDEPLDATGELDGERTRDLTAEPGEHRVRVRVNELIALAREAAERGDFVSAVEAAEAAAAEDPDGVVAPVILHRHRDLLFRIYEGHIGEMTQIPLVSVPLHEIAVEHLDHRTGFLLSRIDGLLTYEDILDVAGMPRMEAYKILSTLLRKGFIEVR